MTSKLIAEEGPLEGLILSFEEGENWVVGRDPAESQLVVADPEVSRKHAIARKTAQGIVLENVSHTNPIQVNDDPLTAPRLLKHGDMLKIGGSRFRFYTEIGSHLDNGEESPLENSEEVSEEEPEASAESEEEIPVGESDQLATVHFGIEEVGPFMLKVISGPNSGAEFSMEPGRQYTIGTAPTLCDVVFHDISISRQHARITVDPNKVLHLEDLGSRNGIFLDHKKVEGKVLLPQHAVVSLGTSSFIVFDREGERQTLITPLLPSIVRSLKDESKKGEKKLLKKSPKPLEMPLPPPPRFSMKQLVIGGAAILLLLLGLFSSTSLFRSRLIEAPVVDTGSQLKAIFTDYPSLQYSYSKDSGRLLLVGHLLSSIDRDQLLYRVQNLPFVKSIDSSAVIIDEFVWKETNQILGKNPLWRGVSMRSPEPGRFVIEGYLKTKKQADQLNDYLVQNFPYLDRLEKRVIVEEDEISDINARLQEKGFRDVKADMANGEVTLNGSMAADKAKILAKIIEDIKKRPTVRFVKNFVAELAPEQTLIDLTNTYQVNGSTNIGGIIHSVVINGRILSKGDLLDGMAITEITPNTIFLEKEGTTYKIDYNK